MATQQPRQTSFPTARELKVAVNDPEHLQHSSSLKQRIRERAYFLAEAAGLPQGRADEFWLRAEKEEAAFLYRD
jgi:hypothetical protein